MYRRQFVGPKKPKGTPAVWRGESVLNYWDVKAPEVGIDGTPFPKSQLTFEARIKLKIDGGNLVREGSTIKVENANSAVLQLVAATSFVNYKNISVDPDQRCRHFQGNHKGRNARLPIS